MKTYSTRFSALLLVSAFTSSSALFAANQPFVQDLNTPRDFPQIDSRKEWKTRAENIREQVLVSCGLWPMPRKTPLQAHVFGKVERDGYSVEKVHFQPLPGFYLGGNLYRPLGRGNGPFPAILNPHGHWKDGRMADNKEGSLAARCISFARQGVIAFSYDMVGFNDTFFRDHGNVPPDQSYLRHRRFATNEVNLLWNISLMGLQTWNSIRALDFLETLPDVDRKRLACTGESGGGTQTFMLGAVDDRLAVQVPVVMVSHTMQGGCLCENAPGLRVEYSNMEIAAAPAPRPQMLVAAAGDWTKDTLTVEGPSIQHIYQLFGAKDKFHFARFNFDHNYNQTSREAVYGWMNKQLLHNGDGTPIKEASYSKEPDADLRVWPDGKLPADAITEAQLIDNLVADYKAQLEALVPSSRRTLQTFKECMLPAWKHTLQLQWPPEPPQCTTSPVTQTLPATQEYLLAPPQPGTGEVKLICSRPTSKSSRGVALLVSTPGNASAPHSLESRLLQEGWTVITLSRFSTEPHADQLANFFSVYNRTEAQERVRDIVRACAFAHSNLKAQRVLLCGMGRAGLWATLAAPAADAVIADCDALDASNETALMAPDLFCPGIRKIGALQGAALLAAPHPLLWHNTGASFPTTTLASAYRKLGAEGKVRIESGRLSDDAIASWVAQLK